MCGQTCGQAIRPACRVGSQTSEIISYAVYQQTNDLSISKELRQGMFSDPNLGHSVQSLMRNDMLEVTTTVGSAVQWTSLGLSPTLVDAVRFVP